MPSPGPVAYRPVNKPTVGRNGWVPTERRTTHLKKGDKPFGYRAVDCDITIEHDIEIKLRDGETVYIDAYMPTSAVKEGKKLPAVLSYSPFGKKYSGMLMLPMTPYKCGVTGEDISGLEKFEGIDPAKWCAWDYIVVSVDARGAGASTGNIPIMGTQEAEDGYDVIEAVAKMSWCDGNVALSGNSHLAIVQWFIASLQPPSLKAIAPWEGCSDLYREQFVRGGIFNMSNFELIIDRVIQGTNGVEDFKEMYRRTDRGIIDAYWADKRVDMTKIKIPTYITGSEFSSIHTMGSLRGWMEIDCEDKWLRWAGWQEWHDLWAVEETNVELRDFFDTFLKGKNNGFKENTPKVRLSVLRYGDQEPIHNIKVPNLPHPDTDYRKLYLQSDKTLAASPEESAQPITYDSENLKDGASFTLKFDKKTHIVGLPKAVLYMSCRDLDDMCLFLQMRKLDKNGKALVHLTIPFHRSPVTHGNDAIPSGLISYTGPIGLLRASHRHIDESKSIHPQYPFHPHDRVEPINPGDIVKLEVGIWFMGTEYEEGQSLRFDISGSNPLWPELTTSNEYPINKGVHNIHIGKEYPSHVILPFVDL